jgi:hypothetical protein
MKEKMFILINQIHSYREVNSPIQHIMIFTRVENSYNHTHQEEGLSYK